jgi:hypothetical protein
MLVFQLDRMHDCLQLASAMLVHSISAGTQVISTAIDQSGIEWYYRRDSRLTNDVMGDLLRHV